VDEQHDDGTLQRSEPVSEDLRAAGGERRVAKLSLLDCTPLHWSENSIDEATQIINQYAGTGLPLEPTQVFITHLTQRPDAYFMRLGQVGLWYLTGIQLHFCANVNVVFWDKKFGRDRRDVVQYLCGNAFDMFDLQRLQAIVPAANRPLRTQLTRCGFREEGVLRNAWLDGSGVQDLHVLGMLRSEKPEWQSQATTSSGRVI